MRKSTVAFLAKSNHGGKDGLQGRPRIITQVHDLQIKREVAGLKLLGVFYKNGK